MFGMVMLNPNCIARRIDDAKLKKEILDIFSKTTKEDVTLNNYITRSRCLNLGIGLYLVHSLQCSICSISMVQRQLAHTST